MYPFKCFLWMIFYYLNNMLRVQISLIKYDAVLNGRLLGQNGSTIIRLYGKNKFNYLNNYCYLKLNSRFNNASNKNKITSKRGYHTGSVYLGGNKFIFTMIGKKNPFNDLNMLLTKKVISNYRSNNNIKISGTPSKIENHRMVIIEKSTNQIDEVGLLVTSTPIHPNKSFNVSQSKFIPSDIMSTPINMPVGDYQIHNVNTSFVKIPAYYRLNGESIISDGYKLTKGQQAYIINRMEMVSAALHPKIFLVSELSMFEEITGKTYKVNKEDIKVVDGGMVVEESKLMELTLKENDTLNYNVIHNNAIMELYINKLTERKIEEIIRNYKRHVDKW
jgi:hypothetical protein